LRGKPAQKRKGGIQRTWAQGVGAVGKKARDGELGAPEEPKKIPKGENEKLKRSSSLTRRNTARRSLKQAPMSGRDDEKHRAFAQQKGWKKEESIPNHKKKGRHPKSRPGLQDRLHQEQKMERGNERRNLQRSQAPLRSWTAKRCEKKKEDARHLDKQVVWGKRGRKRTGHFGNCYNYSGETRGQGGKVSV